MTLKRFLIVVCAAGCGGGGGGGNQIDAAVNPPEDGSVVGTDASDANPTDGSMIDGSAIDGSMPTAAANDLCANATTISLATMHAQLAATTVAAHAELAAPCGTAGQPDVFFKFTLRS